MIFMENDWIARIYYIDDLRTYQTELAKQYAAPEKYQLETYSHRNEFIEKIMKESISGKLIRIAIVSIDSVDDHNNKLEKLEPVHRRFPELEFMLLSKDTVEQSKVSGLPVPVRSVIPKNDNAVLRINNNLKGILSEINLRHKRKAARRALWILGVFSLAVLLAWLFARWRFPLHF